MSPSTPKKATAPKTPKTPKVPTAPKTTGQPPQFIMDEIQLLLSDITNPETAVKFDPPSRATPGTIQGDVYPPAISWTWANEAARLAFAVTQTQVGGYGLQADINVLFRLTSATPSPVVWQPFQTGTTTTWSWPNVLARQAEKVLPADVGKVGIQTDINILYQLTGAAPPVWQPVPNPTNTSAPFELATGASDADSYHDFYRVQVAFQDVWAELLDGRIQGAGETLYAAWDARLNPDFDDSGATDRTETFPAPGPGTISGVEELNAFITFLKAELGVVDSTTPDASPALTQLKNDLNLTLECCNMLLLELNRAGSYGNYGGGDQAWPSKKWLDDTAQSDPNSMSQLTGILTGVQRQNVFNTILNDLNATAAAGTAPVFPDLPTLLQNLDTILKEPYRFDVFAPGSINYGLLLNYRQHWQPQSYQVGNLVSSIPLAPQETRRYTTKAVVKKRRNVKEIDDSLRSTKDESTDTSRVDSEIVDRAKNQTNFQKTASGSFGNDALYKVSAGMQQGQDQSVESAQTRREFHEAVVKSAQEYRNEHHTEISTEQSSEDESTSYREIRNPNDELTVTYLFYELQRRYLVDEAIYKATPIILVANDVPAPHEVDSSWLLRHDWIIKRAILDDSFLPALEYLAANYAGEEVTLQVLGLSVEQQRSIVDQIAQQVQAANAALDNATQGLVGAENTEISDEQANATISNIKSMFDPLGITKSPSDDGEADRARVDFAKDALDRAQTKVNQLVADLKTETTALQVAIDKYTKAATRHFSMLAEIDRLRIHVKDNIIYYMQAIWSYEPADQRFFRLCNLEVPIFTSGSGADGASQGPAADSKASTVKPNARAVSTAPTPTAGVQPAQGLPQIDPTANPLWVVFPTPALADGTLLLHQVADIENMIGFKGNYMMFPMVNFNYMNWFMMQPYLDLSDTTGVTLQDPDPDAALTIDQLRDAIATIIAKDPASFSADVQQIFEEIMTRLLSTQSPELVVVPSTSLYIEALPGTHPLLEDFKLIHRAIDIKKAQAEARHAELENLRLAARLSQGQNGDPDIEKVVVVGTGQNVTVDAGQ